MCTFLVSFHGGSSNTSINNLMVVSSSGSSPALAPQANGAMPALNELRGILFSSGQSTLYVVNAYKDFNQILEFSQLGSGDQWSYNQIYATGKSTHPFDIEFAFGDDLFVSNQDTNDVVSYSGAGSTGNVFASGFKAVRGIAYDGKTLYVADSGANQVYPFSSSEQPANGFAVDQPVHMLWDGSRYVYIGSEKDNSVLAWDTTGANSTNPAVVVPSQKKSVIDHTGGLALDGNNLYAASRKGKQIVEFQLDLSQNPPVVKGSAQVVLQDFADDPEFIYKLR